MANLDQISRWFDIGAQSGQTYMVVVCDTFDHEDYPVYFTSRDVMERHRDAPGEMQRTMEVYDLTGDREKQLDPATKAWA